MAERNTDGCLFAVGCTIYFFDPLTKEVRAVCERPTTVTTIEHLCGDDQTGIWDASSDGVVRHNLEEESVYRASLPVTSIFELYGGHDGEKCPARIARDTWVIIITEYDASAGYLLFRNARTGEVFEVVKEVAGSPTGYPHALATTGGFGQVFWTARNKVFRGFNKGITEMAVVDDSPLIAHCGDGFIVCHFQDDSTHPEGVVISTRDRRTIQVFDPNELGFPRFIGIYEVEENLFLILGTCETDWEEDQDKPPIQVLTYRIYVKKVRSPFYEGYEPIHTQEVRTPIGDPRIAHAVGNPCLTLDLNILKGCLDG